MHSECCMDEWFGECMRECVDAQVHDAWMVLLKLHAWVYDGLMGARCMDALCMVHGCMVHVYMVVF